MIPISPKSDIGAKSYDRFTSACQNCPLGTDSDLFKFLGQNGHFLLPLGRKWVFINLHLASYISYIIQLLREGETLA